MAQAAPWRAPSDVEQWLYEAKTRGDWPGYFDVLARTDLYVADSRARVDAHPGTTVLTPHWNSRTRTECLAVFTAGMLPAPVENTVFDSGELDWFAQAWTDGDPPWMVVNPGSPCEAFFRTTPEHRAVWSWHAARANGGGHPRGQIRTLYVGGALHGPVAHGLACGALLFVSNGEFWNSLANHGFGYSNEKNRLAQWWDITDQESWRGCQERLLDAEVISPVWEFVLDVRRSMALDFGGAVEVEHWRQVAERVLRHNIAAAAEPRITPEGVTAPRHRSEAEVEAQVAGVQRLIGRITRYEARFRADGLLPEGKSVRSVEAWDYGRASAMARWGVGARYCTVAEAEQAVLRAGTAARVNYRSWEEFSAGYILGRCLHFDEEEFGNWYQGVLASHRLLTTDPASPWLNIPWS
ncbi:DUF1266 domain-containing protein [Streptomyces thermolineatus]|uniref:DUF1266 domain-containing protein n=1 Tax=Streptomyces thermolineatus TaxID=44033 RepID=A0ABN3L1L4_9ACTN